MKWFDDIENNFDDDKEHKNEPVMHVEPRHRDSMGSYRMSTQLDFGHASQESVHENSFKTRVSLKAAKLGKTLEKKKRFCSNSIEVSSLLMAIPVTKIIMHDFHKQKHHKKKPQFHCNLLSQNTSVVREKTMSVPFWR